MPKKGYKQSAEHRAKISAANKGRKHSKESRKKMSEVAKKVWENPKYREKVTTSNKGKTLSEDTRAKLSISAKKVWESSEIREKMSNTVKNILKNPEIRKKMSDAQQGENNPNWRGGITSDSYAADCTETLRESVRKRDNYTCQLCGKTQEEEGKNLATHHINYNKEDSRENNLITLCNCCHGTTNFNREYWQQLFEQIMY